MKAKSTRRNRQRGQEGYALVIVMFLLALVVIATVAVAPNILVNGRREKEQEMIWRGKQYVRGIRLYVRYYQMHGGATRFPTSMDDLTKNKVGIRFMRQAYKDPVNSTDGSWRFIYVGPNGQLIGSLKSRPLGTATGTGSSGGFGSLFGNSSQSSFGNSASSGSSFGNSSFGNSSFGNSSFGSSNTSAQANANTASTAGQQGAAGNTTTGLSPDQMSTPQPIEGSDQQPTQIVGGNIIGVGSKVNQSSVIWYDKAKNYRQFEFIWDPSKEPVNGGANAGVVGVPQTPAGSVFGGSNGQSSFGQSGFGQGGSTFGQQPGGGTTGNQGNGQNPPNQPTQPQQTPQQ